MNPFTALGIAAMQMTARIIELRLEHYKENPELRKQDAANAEIWGRWGQKLLTLIDRLFVELKLGEEPGAKS